ncbi:MAG: sialate O-acetylesterase, partial [Chitinophagaceae bacterium]|nr:sialate O-acetylesterase [Chitinophagaceae bacterium]
MNKISKQICALSILFILATTYTLADVRLPAVLSSNMVLQQQSSVKLWGWAAPAEKIYITTSWSTITDSAVATGDAKWDVKVKTPSAGGPYTITIKGRNTIILDNVMIGEVWVCSGQSNMEWSSLNGIQQINDEFPTCANSQLRFFHIPKTTALYPQDDCYAAWTECNAETLKGFSAVAYFFGKQIQQKQKVTGGLIKTSRGGTAAEVWV